MPEVVEEAEVAVGAGLPFVWMASTEEPLAMEIPEMLAGLMDPKVNELSGTVPSLVPPPSENASG